LPSCWLLFRREKDGKTEYLLNSRPHTRDETITKRRRDIFTRVRDFCDEHNYGVFGLNFNLCVDLGFDLNNVTVSESLLTQDEKTIFLTEHGEYRVDGCKTDQEAEQVIIDGGEGSVGIFSKIFVAGGVENVYPFAGVFKPHDRSGYGNAPLLLNLHKVAGCAFVDFVAFHRSCCLYGAAKEEKLFGQGGFASIGVADDGEGFASGDLFV